MKLNVVEVKNGFRFLKTYYVYFSHRCFTPSFTPFFTPGTPVFDTVFYKAFHMVFLPFFHESVSCIFHPFFTSGYLERTGTHMMFVFVRMTIGFGEAYGVPWSPFEAQGPRAKIIDTNLDFSSF